VALVLVSPKTAWEEATTQSGSDWGYILVLAAIGPLFDVYARPHLGDVSSSSEAARIVAIHNAGIMGDYIQSVGLAYVLVKLANALMGENPRNITFVAYSLTPYFVCEASLRYTGFGVSDNRFNIYILGLLAGTLYSIAQGYWGLKYFYQDARPSARLLAFSVAAIAANFALFLVLTVMTRKLVGR
jgi:hypothetical protein